MSDLNLDADYGNFIIHAGSLYQKSGLEGFPPDFTGTPDTANVPVSTCSEGKIYQNGPVINYPTIIQGVEGADINFDLSTLIVESIGSISYAKNGGLDSAEFNLVSNTLTLPNPDYSAPTDSNADNDYEITIQFTDSGSPVPVDRAIIFRVLSL